MRDARLFPSLLGAALLAGCAGPATRADAPAVAVVTAPSAHAAPPVVAPAESMPEAAAPALLAQLERLAPDADPGVLALALEARACAVRSGTVETASRLAVIDYSRPSKKK